MKFSGVFFQNMCGSRKYLWPPKGGYWKIQTVGVSGKCELKAEFPEESGNRGGGLQTKKPFEGGLWILYGTTQRIVRVKYELFKYYF